MNDNLALSFVLVHDGQTASLVEQIDEIRAWHRPARSQARLNMKENPQESVASSVKEEMPDIVDVVAQLGRGPVQLSGTGERDAPPSPALSAPMGSFAGEGEILR